MKVLYSTYPWAFDCPGGGERQLMAWKNHLYHQGIEVSLFNSWGGLPIEHRIFHFFSVMPSATQFCAYIKQKGLKLVISPNLWVTQETKSHYPHKEIHSLLHMADSIIVNSKLERESLSDVYELSPGKFSVVYNGYEKSFLEPVPPAEFRHAYPEIGETPFFVNVANIEPRKNQLTFLKVLMEFPEIKLVNIGNVRDDKYEKQCWQVAGDRLVILGELPYGGRLLRAALSASMGFVMPSLLETPSIAALEAAAYGTPLIVTKIGSTTEYFGSEANYVEPQEPDSIRQAVGRHLAGKYDPLKVQKYARKFSWELSAEALKNTYLRLAT